MLFPIMFPQVPSKHDGHDVWQRSCCCWVTLAHIYFISILPLIFCETAPSLSTNQAARRQLLVKPALLHQRRWRFQSKSQWPFIYCIGVTTTGDEGTGGQRPIAGRSDFNLLQSGWFRFRWWTACSVLETADRIGGLYSQMCGNTEVILSNGNKTPDHRGLTRRNTWNHLKTVLSSHFTAPSTDTLDLHDWLLRAGSRSVAERNEANCSETTRKWSGRWTECGGRH